MNEEEPPTIELNDYYGILNLPKNATEDDIRAAYRRLSLIYHPDKIKSNYATMKKKRLEVEQDISPTNEAKFSSTNEAESSRFFSNEHFELIQEAYEVLINAEKRVLYDKYGKELMERAHSMGVAMYQADELKAFLNREKRKQREFMEDQGFSLKTSLAAHVDASLLLDIESQLGDLEEAMKITSWDRVPTVYQFVLRHEYEKRFLNSPLVAAVSLQSSIFPQEGGGQMSLTGQLSHPITIYKSITANTSLTCGISEDATMHAGPQLSLPLGEFSALNIGGSIIFSQFRIIPTYRATFRHVLQSNIVSSVTFGASNLPKSSSLTLGLDWTPTMVKEVSRSSAGISLTISPRSLSSRFKVKHRLNEDMSLSNTLQLSASTGLELTGSLKRKITQLTSAIIGFSLSPEYGFITKFGFSRKNIKIIFPILLSHGYSLNSISIASVLFGTLTYCLEEYILKPLAEQHSAWELSYFQKEREELHLKKKIQAMNAVALMVPFVEKRRQLELACHGLVIESAIYGTSSFIKTATSENLPNILDVTIPIQALVFQSKLTLHAHSKAYLMGFYDPCLGKEKSLKITYLFRDIRHVSVLNDLDSCVLPRAQDAIS